MVWTFLNSSQVPHTARHSQNWFCSCFNCSFLRHLFLLLLSRPSYRDVFPSSPIVVLRAICLPCTLRLNGWWIYSSTLPLIVICSPARKLIVVVMWQICLWILNANVSLTSRDKHNWRVTMYCDTSFYNLVHQNDGLQQLLIATSAAWSTSVIANNTRCTKKKDCFYLFFSSCHS